MKLIILFISATIISSSIGAEILCIFPLPLQSHTAVYNAITIELLKHGHKITLVTAYPRDNERNHANVTLIDLSFVKADYDKGVADYMTNTGDKDLTKHYIDLIRNEFTSVDLQKLIKSDKKFDLMLIEFVGFSPFHAFAEHFKIPVVGITSADSSAAGHEIMGNVINPIAHPDRLLDFPVARTFGERLTSVIYWIAFRYIVVPIVAEQCGNITEKYFPDIRVKSYYELMSNVDLLLVNVHPALGYVRPILPNTIPLGFSHIYDSNTLPEALKNVLDESKNAVIYISFGTVFKAEYFGNKVQEMLKAIEDLPYLFLWKYNGELENHPKNLILQKWFPQSDLLAHPNVKLFMTQGVMNFLFKFPA